MCNKSVQDQMHVNLQVHVQCIVYTVHCVGCSGLPAKDEILQLKEDK